MSLANLAMIGHQYTMKTVPTHFEGMQLFPHQRRACEALMTGADVLLVSPTGSGKSLCYLLPTRLKRLRTLVVSPLIALMDDQVKACRRLNFNAGSIHSGTSRVQQWQTLAKWVAGDLQIIFTSPERLMDESLRRSLRNAPPGLIAIDEAHCVVTWGKRFRPAYLELASLSSDLGRPAMLATTATATPAMRRELASSLGLRQPELVCVPFTLPNMSIKTKKLKSAAERTAALVAMLSQDEFLPMIIYCQTRRQSDELAAMLQQWRVAARVYHAGCNTGDRQEAVHQFSANSRSVMVATSAFEMGIDIAAVRSVVHMGLPVSLLAYVQGIGRAGRGATQGRATLLYCESDLDRIDALLSRDQPSDGSPLLTSDLQAMRDVYQYATSTCCRLLALNRYFFPDMRNAIRPCGRCDNCRQLLDIHGLAEATSRRSRSKESPC